MRAAAAILADAERFGAMLLQFPWSFRNTEASRARVAELVGLLPGLPVAVEVRHESFAGEPWQRLLAQWGCLPVNVDQPAGAGLALAAHRTAAGAYFRLHGRNAASWFEAAAGRDARYDYLYGEQELDEVAARVRDAAQGPAPVFVVTNNHFRGQAAANALELRHRLGGGRQKVPPDLMRAYPRLARIAAPEDREQADLFGGD
jgi:uncharacterized protein YecE (DUF72 family)